MYEALTGEKPFKGGSQLELFSKILQSEPQPISGIRPDVPKELENVVPRTLQKKPESRYSSSAEILKDLEAYRNTLRAEESTIFDLQILLRRIRKPRIAIPAVGMILLLLLFSVWFVNRQAKIRWARETALPEIERLIETNWRDFTDAYKLAEQAEAYIPDDPELMALLSKSTLKINIRTEPEGAAIYMKPYKSPDSTWQHLGISPLENIRLPIGIFRWKVEKEGYETVLAAASTWDLDLAGNRLFIPNDFMRVLDKKDSTPQGMVRVPGMQIPKGKLDDFFIDKYEVTNKQYKAFIDSGGSRKKHHWPHAFIKNGKKLAWEEAMAEFVDQTGRPGPATWLAGDYPDGQDNYPVTGISWYEAAAYASFAGKHLPTEMHWELASGQETTLMRYPTQGGFAEFAPFSNFNGEGPVSVGHLPGITAYGAYDMAGNVREWCWNETSAGRLIRGGAWDDNTYRFKELASAPPF